LTDYPVVSVDLSDKVAAPPAHFHDIDDLRAKYRYFWNDHAQGYWVLTRFNDIREAFQNPEVFSNHSIVAVDPDPAYRFLPSYSDPPIHMKYRGPMNRWFSPKAVASYTPIIRQNARDLVDEIRDRGSCNYLTDFGDPYPARNFVSVIGLPLEDVPFFIDCSNRIAGTVGSVGADPVGAMNDIKAYYAEAMADRRRHPRDETADFLTLLMGSKIDDRPLDDEEVLDICMTLTFGSLDTTKTVLGWSMWHLATHPGDREWVVGDPDIIPSAVEEFLRAYPIVSMARKLTRDIDFHGCPMKKGDMVLLSIQSATRDPEVFPDPEKVKLDRFPNRHIAFGASEHRCLGSHLARAELQVALQEWHQRIPEYRIPDGAEVLAHAGEISLLSLPLTWEVPQAP
jgi:cytochrome P450